MFEVNSMNECNATNHNLPASPKKANTKTEPHCFANLASVMSSWNPSDPAASRRLLTNEILMLLEGKDYSCVKSYIPAIIVDKQHPIDLLHYKSEKDITEFMTRMLWMHQEYNSAIGIFLGIPDKETAVKVKDAYKSLMMTDEDCIVLLM